MWTDHDNGLTAKVVLPISFLVLTANDEGVPLVKPGALRLAAFEGKAVRPGNRRMATIAMSRAAHEIELR